MRRPRTGQHHVKLAMPFLRERYLRPRAQARAGGEDLNPIELGR